MNDIAVGVVVVESFQELEGPWLLVKASMELIAHEAKVVRQEAVELEPN
jgi:hypothetical protein